MVQFDQLAKERLIEATTPQTFGRLLLKVVDHAHSSLLALQGNQIDATDSRFYLYEWAREYRELLLQILIFGKFQRMLPTIDTVVHVTNNVSMIREDVRKRGMELFEAQWPPLGTLPTPVPIYAVDVAADILSCGTYLRLPELTTLAVKQTDSLNVSTNVDLSPAEKEAVLTRVSEESRLNWLLSEVPKDKVTFRMLNDRFEVEILHEIRVHIIDDFSTWQMVDCEPLIGRVLGSEASAAARLGIENSLKTALNFHHAKIELFDTLGKMRLSHMSEELKTAEDRLQLLEGTALTPFRALQVAEEDSDLSHEQEVHLLSEEISRLHREMREDAEEFAGVHMRLDWFLVIYNEGHRLMSRVAVEWLRNLAETVSGVYGYPGGVAGVYFRTLKGPTIEDLTENPVNSDRLGSRGLPSIRRCASIINYENRNRLEQLSVLDIEILTEFDTTLSLVDSCGLGWTPPALIDDNELYESFFHRPLLETVDSATHLTPKYVRQARNPCLRFLMNRMTGDVHVSLWPITQWLEQVDELPDTLAATLRLLEQTPQWQALSHFDCSRLDLSYWTSLVHSTMSFLLVCGGVHLWSVGTTLGLTSFDVMSTRDSISLQALQLWQQNVECPVLHPLVFGIDPPAVYSLILRIDDLRIDVALCPWSGKPSLEFRYDRSGWMNECTRLFDALSKATLDLRSLSVLLPAFCRALDQESFYRCVPLSYVTCADPNETAVLNESFGLPEESEDRPVEDSALAAQEATEEADHHDLHLDYYRRIQ
ncbi:MAG: hypothetical protein KVP17_001079, partial [Porospora cf. gigantea B]|uniref:uncharacterized protein n=2 Tax=Porospora cf. gigantea B TaxID=2853592 RepID=UPI003571D349